MPYSRVTGIVLERQHSGEHMLRLKLFSGDRGIVAAYLRVSRSKALTEPPPDLFDRLDAVLQTRNEERTWFVKEFRVARRFSGIGNRYEILQYAARFAGVLLKNPFHGDRSGFSFPTLLRALEAWDRGAPPAAVYFKALYLYARGEGFPVVNDWRHRLSPGDREQADEILVRPLDDRFVSDGTNRRLIESLQNWLEGECEVRFP